MTKVEADLAQAKHMARKRHGRASDAQTEKGKTREGHDRIMPKKDIAELDQGKAGQYVIAQRLFIKLSRQHAVRTSLWYVNKVVALCDTEIECNNDRESPA